MSRRNRDLVFALVVGGLLFVLILTTFQDKPTNTPDDEQHRPFRAAMVKGAEREVVEKGCEKCHNPATRALPQKHPPKEQCLICHALQQTN